MDQVSIRPGIWEIICQDVAGVLDIPADIADDVPPIYEPVVRSRSPSRLSDIPTLSTCGPSMTLDNELPSDLPSTLYHSSSFLQMEVHETFTYTYNLSVGDARVQVIILVESDQEFERPNHFVFSLSVKIGSVERAIAKPITMKLSIDPGGLDFVVFAFAPGTSLLPGCLYHLRVWLRSAGIDHPVFGERDLWFGKDPDFSTITDASFTSLHKVAKDMSTYQGTVGRAHVSFILRWTPVESDVYALSLEYEAGGVGKTLFENYHLRLDCEPRTLSFLIYSIPVSTTPTGASHRLRLWLRTPHQDTPESYLYQRLWKSDDFKIGAQLRFDASDQLILATRATDEEPPLSAHGLGMGAGGVGLGLSRMPLARRRVSRLIPVAGVDEAVESIDDV